MTEFAVVFPVQLLLTLGIMQLSLIFCGQVLVQHAAFAAARAVLVADVPPPGSVLSGKNDASATRAREDALARRAAAIVLSTVAPSDDEVGAGTASFPGELSWKNATGETRLVRSRGAFGFTRVTVVHRGEKGYDEGEARVTVEHDLALIVPVVNRWFAGEGALGAFWYGPERGHPVNAASARRGVCVLPISKTGILPRPWRSR